MKVPIRWLGDYVSIEESLEQLAERLTLAGLEVGAVEQIGEWWDPERIVVGELREVIGHPNADRLVLADVAYGGPEVERCVTGAPNLLPFKGSGKMSLKVAFAMEGAELYDGHKEGFVKMQLKRTKIRGVPSRAMVCSEKELGISDEHEGILFLPDDAPVGVPLTEYLGDTVLDLDLTPNLARCFSMLGVARETAALTGSKLRYPSTEWQADGPPASELARVVIEDPDLCARYIGTIIQNVQIVEAPRWMQDRVRRAGMRPINCIVDITNYVMLEWGQPLHAFDYDKLVARAGGAAPTIIVRRAKPGERMTTLDGVERRFSEDTLLICDTAGPVAVAGVMGGYETEIDDNTRNILLESANFDLVSIRRTTQALKLPSEASLRFGKGIHPAIAEPAVRRASELMRKLGSGTIARGMLDAYPMPPQPVVIDLTTSEIERSLGTSFALKEVVDILDALEFQCVPAEACALRVTVPEHRLDCQYPADLIEEIARVYGYDRLPATVISDRLPPQRTNRNLLLDSKIRRVLVGCGLQDTITYALTKLPAEAALDPNRGVDDLDRSSYVSVTNPITQDRSVMRHSLLTTALEVAASNLRFRETVGIFEVGKVFPLEPGSELPDEPRHLSIIMSGPRHDRHWLGLEGSAYNYFDVKGVVETLLERLHIDGATFEPAGHPSFQPGRTARLCINAAQVGVLGEIHPAVRAGFGLPEQRVAAAELDLELLAEATPSTWYVEPTSAYPAVFQDLALVVDDALPASKIHEMIVETGGFLLKEAHLFDVYRGEPVPMGKKSLAYALVFQAPDKTLKDRVVAKQVERIVGRLHREFGAELRS